MKKQFVKVLSLVMALMMVVGTFSTMTFAADEHVHTKGAKGATVAPTCYGNGYTWYTCAGCGEQYMDDVVEKLAHVFTTATKAADCTTAAFTYSKCTNAGCGLADGKGTDANPSGSAYLDQKFVEGSVKLGHSYTVKYTAPTCEKDAESKYVCTRCNKDAKTNGELGAYPTTTHAGTKLVHKYTYTLVSAATGCVDGAMTGVCANCNKSINIAVAAPHKYVEDNAHDCNNIANGIVCLDCGKVALQGTTVYLWDVTTKKYADAATTAGAVTYESNNYKAVHTYDASQISMLEVQNMGYSSVNKAATCVADGWSINYCTKCQKHIVTVAKATGEHAYVAKETVALTVNEAANGTTCHTAVVIKYECSHCGTKKSETIREATAHTLYEVVVDATCTTEGLVNTYCKYCTKFNADGTYLKGYKNTRYTTAKLGHEWKKDGNPVGTDCTTGIKQNYKCNREDCTATKYEWDVEVGTCNFTNSWKDYAATCAAPAYRVPMCKVCGAVDTDPAKKQVTGTLKDANNHVVPAVSAMVVNKAPTCTATGINYYTCANADCAKQGLTYVTKALGHAKSKAISIIVDGKTKNAPKYNNKTLTDSDIKDATCNATGLKMGEWCTRCNTWLTQPSVIAKNPKKHVNTGVVIETISEKTCSTDHIVKVSYSCCSTVAEQLGADGNATGTCSVDATWIKTKAAKIDKVSCTVGGNHEYKYCPGCNWVYEVVTAGCTCGMTTEQHANASATLNPVIPGLGHDWEDKDGHVETCTDAGWTDYKQCKRCNVTQGYKVIPAHNNKFNVGNTGIKESAPTCTKPGVSYNNNTNYTETVKNVCSKCNKKEVPAKPHSWTKTDIMNANVGVANDCTSASFEVYTCTAGCGQFRIFDRSYQAGQAAHDWNAMWNEYTLKNGVVYLNGKALSEYHIADGKVTLDGVVVDTYANGESFEYCGFVARKFKTCANVGCTEELIENKQAPAAHYYIVDGVMTNIDLNCKKVSAFYGVTCAGCNKEVVATAAAGKLSAAHNFKYAEKAATCTTNGYQITACVDCGTYDKIDGKDFNILLPMIGHDGTQALLLEHVEPTGSKDGYKKYQCLREGCGQTYTITIESADVTFTFEAVNNLNDKANVVNSGIVSLVIKTNAAKVDVNSIKLAIGYDVKKLTFVDAQVLNSAFANRAFAGAETSASNGVKYETGRVNVAVSAPNSTAGKIQNVTLNGDNVGLVKLNFKVREDALNEGQAFADGKAYFETIFWCESAEVLSKDGKVDRDDDAYITVKVAGNEASKPAGVVPTNDKDYSYGALALVGTDANVESLASGKVWAVATVKVYALGDVNMDGIMSGAKNASLDDAIALVKIWTNESELGKYSGAADIDKDGAITVADYELLMMYITNEISYNAFLNKGVEPAVEDGKMEVTVGPNGEIIIKPVA